MEIDWAFQGETFVVMNFPLGPKSSMEKNMKIISSLFLYYIYIIPGNYVIMAQVLFC